MRRLHDEHHGTTACNDADSCPTLRTGVRGISLTAPLDAQAGTEVQIGLLPRLQPHVAGALYGDAVEVLAHSIPHDTQGKPAIHYTTVYKVFAKWADDGSLWQAFVASVRHLAVEKQLDMSVLHGDGTNTVAKKGGMVSGSRGTNIRKGRRSSP